jgi:tetratricopeptide (TPR) repeat protein
MRPLMNCALTTCLAAAAVLFNAAAAPAADSPLAARVDTLVSRGSYAAAFRLLDQADARHADPALLEKKIHLCLNHAASTVMHRSFIFVDLKPGQTMDDYALDPSAFQAYTVYDFAIDTMLEARMKEHPAEPLFPRLLADYYFAVYHHYGDRWFLGPEKLLALTEDLYLRADAMATLDRQRLEKLATVSLIMKKYDRAISVSRRIVDADPGYGNGNYALAQACYGARRLDCALEYALKAADHFPDPPGKSDAFLLAGLICEDLGRSDQALAYYRKARNAGRHEFFVAGKILALSLAVEDESLWYAESSNLLTLDLDSIECYYEIMNIFFVAGRTSRILDIFDRLAGDHQTPRVHGNLYLSTAVYYRHIARNRKKSIEMFQKALAEFKKIFPDTHEAVIMIKKELAGGR